MSESQATSTSTGTTTAAPRTPPRRTRLWLTSRVLATAGAVLFAIGAWMPWEQVTGHTVVNDTVQEYTLRLSPGDLVGLDGFWSGFPWAALTVAGLLLLPFLWRRMRLLPHVVTFCLFVFWVLMVNVAMPSKLFPSGSVDLVPETGLTSIVITAREDLAGAWLGLTGVGLMVAACLALIVELARVRHVARDLAASQVVRARLRIPGMGMLTAGIVLWALGTLVLPWASVGCPSVVLLAAQCSGLNYSGVLRLGIVSSATAFDPLAAVYAIPTLLAAGALLILLATWWGRIGPAFCLWVTLWLAAAALFTALGANGAHYAIANAARLGLPAGAWQPDSGGTLTIIALAVVAAGTAVLWYGVLRRPRPAQAA